MTREQIIDKITTFLEEEECPYEYNDELMRFDFQFELHSAIQRTNILLAIDDDCEGLVCMGYLDIGIEEDTRRELERLLFLMNSHMLRGTWQIHKNEIRFMNYVTLDGEEAVLTDEMIGGCLFSVPFNIERYARYIVAVITGLSTAEAEIERIDAMEEETVRREEEGDDLDELPFEDDPDELPFEDDRVIPPKGNNERLIEIPSEFEGGKPLYLRLKGKRDYGKK